MKQLLFVYNPKAGRQRAKTMLSDVLTVFAQEGYQITVRPTKKSYAKKKANTPESLMV